MPSERLKTSTKLLYGLGDVGNAIVNSAVQFYLLIFYTDTALVGPALAAQRSAAEGREVRIAEMG